MKFTGRQFKCIALDEQYAVHWADSFELGETYNEIVTKETSGLLLALAVRVVKTDGEEKFFPFSVDAECFDLI